MMRLLQDDWAIRPEALPFLQKTGGDSVTNIELLALLIAIASLALTIYFGKR